MRLLDSFEAPVSRFAALGSRAAWIRPLPRTATAAQIRYYALVGPWSGARVGQRTGRALHSGTVRVTTGAVHNAVSPGWVVRPRTTQRPGLGSRSLRRKPSERRFELTEPGFEMQPLPLVDAFLADRLAHLLGARGADTALGLVKL